MSLPITTRATNFTSVTRLLIVLAIIFAGLPAFAGWTIDFSRRESQMRSWVSDSNLNNSQTSQGQDESMAQNASGANFLDGVVDTTLPTQDIVILNTDQGFIPSKVRVREGQQYRIVVVNVNKKERNASFIMDAFNEHDATFYGKLKSFYIHPKKDGVYSYESPETSMQGELIVYPANSNPQMSPTHLVPISLDARAPASE